MPKSFYWSALCLCACVSSMDALGESESAHSGPDPRQVDTEHAYVPIGTLLTGAHETNQAHVCSTTLSRFRYGDFAAVSADIHPLKFSGSEESPSLSLTAAHCLKGAPHHVSVAFESTHDWNRYAAAQAFVHPNWYKNTAFGSAYNLAVVFLESTDAALPAAYSLEPEVGVTKEEEPQVTFVSTTLKESTKPCASHTPLRHYITTNVSAILGGAVSFGFSPLAGIMPSTLDSGGAALDQDNHLVGIHSHTNNDGSAEFIQPIAIGQFLPIAATAYTFCRSLASESSCVAEMPLCRWDMNRDRCGIHVIDAAQSSAVQNLCARNAVESCGVTGSADPCVKTTTDSGAVICGPAAAPLLPFDPSNCEWRQAAAPGKKIACNFIALKLTDSATPAFDVIEPTVPPPDPNAPVEP